MREKSAATALEYGLILAGLSMGIILALNEFALGRNAIYDTVTNAITSASSTSTSTSSG
jgi:Flp pilus assembly pilin Flp